MLKYLLFLTPPHKTYVEVFGGAAHLLFAKSPSPVEVYNDIDGRLVNFFKVLQNPEKAMRMLYILANTPYSRQIHDEYQDTLDEGDEVERAVKFFVVIWQSYSGGINNVWGYSVSSKRVMPASYLGAINLLPLVHYRLQRVYIESDDFRKIIPRYDTKDTFFYLDPPYVLSTLKSSLPYVAMSDKDHEDLVDILLGVSGKALLSGYPNKIYERLERSGWNFVDVDRLLAATNPRKTFGGKRIFQTERLWWNYDISGDLPENSNGEG